MRGIFWWPCFPLGPVDFSAGLLRSFPSSLSFSPSLSLPSLLPRPLLSATLPRRAVPELCGRSPHENSFRRNFVRATAPSFEIPSSHSAVVRGGRERRPISSRLGRRDAAASRNDIVKFRDGRSASSCLEYSASWPGSNAKLRKLCARAQRRSRPALSASDKSRNRKAAIRVRSARDIRPVSSSAV